MSKKRNRKKAKELKNFKPDEVSLVSRGANMKSAFIVKNHEEETNMDKLLKQLADFKFANKDKTDEAITKLAKAEGLSDDQVSALKTALAVMETVASDMPRGFSFNMDEGYASVSVYKAEEEAEKETKEEASTEESSEEASTEEAAPESTEAEASSEAAEPEAEKEEVEKAESVAKTEEVAEKIIALPTHIQKQLDDQEVKIAKLLKIQADSDVLIAKAEDEKIEKEFVAIVKSDMPNLGKAEDIGRLLKTCKEKLEDQDFNFIESVFKKASSQIEEGDLFTEFGSSVEAGESSSSDAEDRAMAKVAKIREENPGMTIQKARVTAREEVKKEDKQK